MTAPDVSAPPTPPAKASLMEDLIDIWFTPSQVFARRVGAGVWGPLLVVVVLFAVLMFANRGAFQGVLDAEVERAVATAMADNPSMSADQAQGMRSIIETSISFSMLLGVPIVLCLLALCIWAVGRMLGGTLGFGTAVMIASFSYLPKVLEMVLVTVQSLVLDTSMWTGRYQFSWGVGRFLDPAGKQGMVNLLGRIDLFTLWVTVLIAIGLVHAAKVERAKAWMGAAAIWVIGATPALWQLIKGQ